MGWVYDTGYGPAYDHDGFARPVVDGHEDTDDVALVRLARDHGDRVTGWHAACSCGWRSAVVYSRADYPASDRVAYLAPDALDDFGGPIESEWRAHIRQTLPELAVHDALADEAAGRGPVERAVRQAREAGASWAAIGRAAGITRQSAHERWAHLEDADSEGRSFRKDSSSLLIQYALAGAADELEVRGPRAVATRSGDEWRIEVTDAADDVLGTAVLASAEWAPASAGHRLIEAGWTVCSAAHFVRDRAAGWARRDDGTWTAPVLRDDA